MKPETKNCKNCKKEFTIESEDFAFYEKIKVPSPTWCPQCRMQRRWAWRNDWHLFKKTDALTGKKIFSFLPEESPVKIYDREYWISDAWDPMDYGQDYDFSRSFFEQFKELLYNVPLPSTSMVNVVNCQYCTNANNIKNCYFVRGCSFTEDSVNLIWDQYSKQCFDSHMTNNCELSYGNVNTIKCYKTFYSVDCESSQDLILCNDCVGCNNCFGSVGLRNKSYYIFNEQHSREEYLRKISDFNLGSRESFEDLKNKSYMNWLKFPCKYMHGAQNLGVSGDYIYESKNAKDCFRVNSVEDSKYIQNVLVGPVKDSYDYSNFGQGAELIYECLVVGIGVYNVKFSTQCYPNVKNISYCIFSNNSSDLFGCVGLRKKQYCILNKQYTKEEYEKLVSKIIEKMTMDGEYGEFFPANMSYIPYKTTAAYEFFPINEQEARDKGFAWYETEKSDYRITLENKNIPDDIKDVDENILNETTECAHKGDCKCECTKAFKIIKAELDFLKRMNLPPPVLCHNCRHSERLKQRNIPKLYKRSCMCDGDQSSPNAKNHAHHKGVCKLEFETTYAPDRPEIVYCEKCYQQEIY